MKNTLLILFLFSLGLSGHSQSFGIKIGSPYNGGIVYNIDQTGKHGLICTPTDILFVKIPWGKNGETGADSKTDGQMNTKFIVNHAQEKRQENKFAACICDTLSLGGFTDWYMPSLEELEHLYIAREEIRGLVEDDYMSSTEANADDAWHLHFQRNKKPRFHYNKTAKDYFFRCIRKF